MPSPLVTRPGSRRRAPTRSRAGRRRAPARRRRRDGGRRARRRRTRAPPAPTSRARAGTTSAGSPGRRTSAPPSALQGGQAVRQERAPGGPAGRHSRGVDDEHRQDLPVRRRRRRRAAPGGRRGAGRGGTTRWCGRGPRFPVAPANPAAAWPLARGGAGRGPGVRAEGMRRSWSSARTVVGVARRVVPTPGLVSAAAAVVRSVAAAAGARARAAAGGAGAVVGSARRCCCCRRRCSRWGRGCRRRCWCRWPWRPGRCWPRGRGCRRRCCRRGWGCCPRSGSPPALLLSPPFAAGPGRRRPHRSRPVHRSTGRTPGRAHRPAVIPSAATGPWPQSAVATDDTVAP